MQVSMAEVNKKANQIINRVAESGETVVIVKHGRPIAEIRPIANDEVRETALSYLTSVDLVTVEKSV
jgi:prevent-host-death family protein